MSIEFTPKEARAGMKAVFRLFDLWALSDAHARVLLGMPSEQSFIGWRDGAVDDVPSDVVWRLGDLLGIHKSLRLLFADPVHGYEWIHKQNSAFGGRSALDLMLGGAASDLTDVRRYLQSECER